MSFLDPYMAWVKGGAALVLLGALSYAGYQAYDWAYTNGENAANVRAEKVIAEFARKEAEAQAKARQAEQANARAVAKAAEEYERGKADAKATGDRVAAGLLAGTERLRDEWAAERATNRLSDAATAARHADELAQLRAASAGRIVQIGAEADAQVRGLQRVVRADRGQ